MSTASQPDVPEPIDLGPMFTTQQIHTDEHGVHRDESGQEHEAVDVGGEVTYQPIEDDDPGETVGSWPAPSWATNSAPDAGGVWHAYESAIGVRQLPEILGQPGHLTRVELSQADHILDNGDGTVIVVRQAAPEVHVGDLRMSVHEAGRLAAALHEVIEVAGSVQ